MAKRNTPAVTRRKVAETAPITWATRRTALIAASGWLVAVFLGLLELPAKVNSFFNEAPAAYKNVTDFVLLDQQYSGVWTSDLEGVIDATDEERTASTVEGSPVVLRLRVYHGEVEGELYSGGLEKHYVHTRLTVEGRKRWSGTIDAIIYDYMDGKKTALAQFELALDEKAWPPLRLKVVHQPMHFLPETISLYRKDDAFPDDLGGINVEFYKKVLKRFNPDPDLPVDRADQKQS
ncbi:hypothetical protein LB535_05165 [Mesorhizobium sp. CA10]|uniref:hypothetical protein n=1 Tax=Mesorhizobium sp. CA10 TaxID=588495 RepID=UPI001CCCD3AB|nr:hypothetical protein [Mesorhizobium sp. CA10]MBZ9881736.1 hypothetical protein [Mesorhizobium sp. CA10]